MRLARLAAPLVLIAAIGAEAQEKAPEKTPGASFAVVGATVMTAGPAGTIAKGTVLVAGGKIAAVGAAVEVPPGTRTIDASGRFLLPGIVDTHSHMGVYPYPGTDANADGNEATSPITPEVRAEDSVHLEDPAFEMARAGGVTCVMILPGSANLIGGEACVVKLRKTGTLEGMKFQGAPRNMKMACGENPKRVYGGRNQAPSTRMGELAYLRKSFTEAVEYGAKWKLYEEKRKKAAEKGDTPPEAPETDLRKAALLDIVEGRVQVQLHGYTVTDYTGYLRVFDEFGIKPRAFHHALEAYKMRDEIARRGIGVSTWADWWGFKMEAYDGIPENAALCAKAGIRVAIHSDSASGVQRLWHEASKCVRWGMPEDEAIRAITINPAWQIGVDKSTGSIEVGKDADLSLFAKHPFDVTTRVDATFIDGVEVFERQRP
jgi:imidazolonepropionase-like amidohydrolase